jgi:hypothetical protein
MKDTGLILRSAESYCQQVCRESLKQQNKRSITLQTSFDIKNFHLEAPIFETPLAEHKI